MLFHSVEADECYIMTISRSVYGRDLFLLTSRACRLLSTEMSLPGNADRLSVALKIGSGNRLRALSCKPMGDRVGNAPTAVVKLHLFCSEKSHVVCDCMSSWHVERVMPRTTSGAWLHLVIVVNLSVWSGVNCLPSHGH